MTFQSDVVLLPIPSSRDGVSFCDLSVAEEKMRDEIKSGDAVIGYAIPKKWADHFAERGVCVFDMETDEELLQYNAALTADAALGKILTMSNRAPRDLDIGIIGCGRIGYRLLGGLTFLGANVTVFTTSRAIEAEVCAIGAHGVNATHLSDCDKYREFSNLDILINTAPARLISESVADLLAGKLVIELASGDNIPKQIEYVRWGSLPGKVYPMSAGYALGKYVVRAITTIEQNKRMLL